MSLQIADIHIASPLLLAPLAGYTNLPFRHLCREYGAGLCFSEMISCFGLAYGQQKTVAMLATAAEESPVSFQLFGADVGMMGKAAQLLNAMQPQLLDINMGCPVKKVTKKGAGAALMGTPKLAEEIIKKVVAVSRFPVTVKFRLGVDKTHITCVDFAKMAEDSGAAAVIVHGRTWSQGFTGTADWEYIARVKENVTVPVIGNGDIVNYQNAMYYLEKGYADGVMIGRGALGNPWVFSPAGKPATLAGRVEGALQHLNFIKKYLDTRRSFASTKNHIGRYFTNIKGSSAIRKGIYACASFSDLYHYLTRLQNQSDW